MTDYHFLNIALGICMNIYGKIYPFISDVDGGIFVNSIDDSQGAVMLTLKEQSKPTTFAVIDITVSEVELEKKQLWIEVIGTKKEDEFAGRQFGEILVNSIMKDYASLQPVVRDGIIHTPEEGKPKGQASREFEVRFRIFSKSFDITEDFDYEYDMDEIGDAAIPYVKALHEIHSKVYRN